MSGAILGVRVYDQQPVKLTFPDWVTVADTPDGPELRANWRPVSEAPPDRVTMLVKSSGDKAYHEYDRGFYMAYLVHDERRNEYWWACPWTGDEIEFDVTHWMPLPEGPR